MSNTKTSSKVPMGQKIAFGLGMLANQMFPAALGIFMVVLVQNLGFPTWMWGILFFLPRVFDSITDPIMGFISDNTRSVWGRRRQYVFLGAIIMGISFALMWQLYKDDGLMYNFTYFLIWSLVFYLGLTIFSVPYVAMGYEMSDDFHERTNIMAVAQWIGQWAWVIAPWFWVIMYDPSWFEGGADVATRTIAIWVAVACAILAMVPAVFIKSKSTKDDVSLTPLTLKTIGGSLKQIVENFKEAFKIPVFRKLCFSTFLIFNAFNTVAGFSFFIVVYYLFNGDAGAAGIWPTLLGSIGALITTFLVIPIVAKMSKTWGKKKAFLVSQGISVIGYLMLWFLFIPGKPYMFLFALPFFSFGIGSLFTLMMSMTSDVIDIDELNTGKRREGVFGAIYWWMVKFGFAIAGLLTGAIMSLVGFVPDAVNSEASVTGIRLFYSGLPIVGTLAAMWIMRNYDLTEEKAVGISAQLAKRKAEKKSKEISSGYGVGNLLGINGDLKLGKYSEIDFSNKDANHIESLFSTYLQRSINGLCFSPYIEGQDAGDILSSEQIYRRTKVISPYIKWVRSFSCIEGNELIPEAAHNNNKKAMVGAWISNDKARNEKEIEALIKLAKEGFVDIAAVGNEVLLRGDLTEEELIIYINRVKEALSGLNIPVGYVDTYYEYYNRPKLVAATDIILANCYPFWEGFAIEEALTHLRQMHALMQNVANGKKIIIAETGWPSQGETIDNAKPTKLNAMKYFIQTQEWATKEGVEMFYFSSFDESWKIRIEGELGARWGIWDKDEKLKYS
ncbi:MFS transporter [Lacinutrix sp. Bg11-31]|uniref:MFS transporter n=1 Tax=Lacinutrix sp. Bg11-31 TaxID=2057808 RepID=UPI000C30EF0C|nr:MFS transporter [Lacinutrix sp. Bg11-31]AUC81766.1 glycosyl hydrolase [Lacinutrix sp. Bg11-31]